MTQSRCLLFVIRRRSNAIIHSVMFGTTRTCPLFTKMVDSFSPISATSALLLKNTGVGAVGRYLENLTTVERDRLFAAGLGILLLSEAPVVPLTQAFGLDRADKLLEYASVLDVPDGAHLMLDFEAQHGEHADVISYSVALSSDIARHGYVPLAYVGAGQLLSGSELYSLPDVHLYWRGGSLDMPEPSCGFAIWQVPPLEQTIAGSNVDMSITGADLKDRRPILWYPS